ncbi:MAG: type II secretion system protein [Verrucomicrobiales bacterium]|nr:type II secretion system protein [Verrucomicrobiales bacterium]
MNLDSAPRHFRSAFSLIEMLIVISIISIMATLVISSFSSASNDTRRVLGRQQQAALQNAVNAWVSATSVGNVPGSQKPASLEYARGIYNATGTPQARLLLVQGYLDAATFQHFSETTTNSAKVQTDALKKLNQYIDLPSWTYGSYPQVNLITEP